MNARIRAELAIESADVCPLTELPASTTGRSLAWTQSDTDVATEEFAVDGDDVEAALDTDVERVFSAGDRDVYRFERETTACPCEVIETYGSPIVDAYARDGTLHVVFHVRDVDTLRDVVREVRERFGSVSVHRLVRTGEAGAESDVRDLVLVDRGELTDRQREVLETAHESGYFEHPREANAGDVATELGVNRSTFVEHLVAAQSKLLSSILADG